MYHHKIYMAEKVDHNSSFLIVWVKFYVLSARLAVSIIPELCHTDSD